jgi:hypothetical protein
VPGEPEREPASNWMVRTRTRLALRRMEKPSTKAGQIRAIWPEIEAALAVGQSVKSVCKWLEEDAGISLGVTTLTSYISRIRRHERPITDLESRVGRSARAQIEAPEELRSIQLSEVPAIKSGIETKTSDDPLAQTMRALSRPKMDIRKIHNDGDPEGSNLI